MFDKILFKKIILKALLEAFYLLNIEYNKKLYSFFSRAKMTKFEDKKKPK
jgi:hypothetical protein